MATASVPSVVTPTDTDIFNRASALVEQSARVPVIADAETASKAGDLAKFLKVAATKVDEIRDARVRPLNQQVKEINAEFKPFIEVMEMARKTVLAKVTAWQIAEDKRRREEAEAARLEALRKQQEAEAEALRIAEEAAARGDNEAAEAALAGAVEATEAPLPSVPTKTATVARGYFGSTTSLRDNWTAEVVDFAALPDTFKVVNEAALRGLKGTRPEIPGVRWVNTPSAVTR